MEQVWKNLQSPDWWFTAVLVGLVVGIVAAYAKDGLNKLASSISTSYAARVERNRAHSAYRVRLWVANPSLLIIEYMRAFMLLLAALLAFYASMASRAWQVFVRHFPEVDPLGGWLRIPEASPTVRVALALALYGLAFAYYLRALTRLIECNKARFMLIEATERYVSTAASDQCDGRAQPSGATRESS